ncbi:MAG: hypothetical protein JST90_16070 [Bacteroidetes bacterium]|nr:hypothetical protein [Bacteroidota bacterium]
MDLSDIVFHDLPVTRVDFQIADATIVIGCLLYDEVGKGHIATTISFREISALQFEAMTEAPDEWDIEICTAQMTNQGDKEHISLTFLLGLGKPSWQLEFDYKTVTIT